MSKHMVGWAACLCVLMFHHAGRGGEQDAKDLVIKAIKAAGGEAKVGPLKIGACKVKANIQENGQQINSTIEVSWNRWDQYRLAIALDVNGMAKNLLVVINGDKAWVKDMDNNKVETAPKEVAPLIRDMLYALRMPQTLPELLDKDMKLSPLGEIKVGDRAALGVTITHKDHKDVRLFFDKETGLPAKAEVQLTGPQNKELAFEFLYQDFKEANGVKHPMRVTIKADGKEFVMELSDVEARAKVEPGLFAMPE